MVFHMTATRNNLGADVFRLKNEKEAFDIDLTDGDGTDGLKRMFSALLEAMIADGTPSSVAYEETPGYDQKMYKEICKEYVEILNSELVQAYESLKEEGLVD